MFRGGAQASDGSGNPIYIDSTTGEVVDDPATTQNPNAVVYTTTTDATGSYLFDNLPEGTYEVVVDTSTLPTNSYQSYDSDGITTSPNSSTHTLEPILNDDDITVDVEDNTDQDFGYYIGLPSWTLEKTTTSTPMNAGDTLEYSFDLENT